ncbi:MAG TPA: SRPBCC domain-containing protein [Haliscomenobacter sp.]|uniref:SRPBCC domain-containing protein n=1 Tax=Haliscomenobacter sp. TaxID=2717303 RepID=UPI002C963293|nr:SRPBCC domain-containing protein [Haliscomenobacter sp.]HOY17321.1 SRPBCC domain-containing protein [Haliscomenobacter sp.]HPH19573.1 SRPBCC domain-containing protein [Haliscomenobacter sp.]
MSATTSTGKALTTKTTFSRETAVSIEIQADASIVWSLLTNAADFARWNSTVVSIEGDIALGQTIQLKSILDPQRIFKLKVKEVEANKKLVWGDAMGNRVYTLIKDDQGHTVFSMAEKIGGLMFPLFARFIPPFDASFEQFAADLKKEAESIMQAN